MWMEDIVTHMIFQLEENYLAFVGDPEATDGEGKKKSHGSNCADV